MEHGKHHAEKSAGQNAPACCADHAAHQAPAALKDPVCGMAVTPQSPHHHRHGGTDYYFCCAGCRKKFADNPERYLGAETTEPKIEVAAGTVYTCPMHPEIRQDRPGVCPKCGMALEPEMPSLDDEQNPELKDFQRRFWFTLPLTILVTLLAMLGHRFGWFAATTQSWIELVLSLPIVLWAGWPFFVRGAQSVVHRSPNMWTLIATGTGAAFLYSVAATVMPGLFPVSFMSMGRIGVYFEAAVVIISLTLLGQILELQARTKTGAAIRSLL